MSVTKSKQQGLLLPLFLLAFSVAQGILALPAVFAEEKGTSKSLLTLPFFKQQPSLLEKNDTAVTSRTQIGIQKPSVQSPINGANVSPRRNPSGNPHILPPPPDAALLRNNPEQRDQNSDSDILLTVRANDEVNRRPANRVTQAMFNINTPPDEYGHAPIVAASGLLPLSVNDADLDADNQPRRLRPFPAEADPKDLPTVASIEKDDQPVVISTPVLDPSHSAGSFSLASAMQNTNQRTGDTISPEPVPDDRSDGMHLHDINVAAMKSAAFIEIQPGETEKNAALAIMKENDGQLIRTQPLDATSESLIYTVEGLGIIEITIQNSKVFSIVLQLPEPFPSEQIRRDALESELRGIRAILVPDSDGYILGQMFPEKGVIFSFTRSNEPGVPSQMVNQIAIEPITSGPFQLRGERFLTISNAKAKWDLTIAVLLDPNSDRARWLLAKALLADGQLAEAHRECKFAVQLQPNQPQYNVTLAEIIGKAGYTKEARQFLEDLLPYCANAPHLKGHAECLLGDFYRDDVNLQDFVTANKYHRNAIETVKPLCTSSNPTLRQSAKLVQMNAFLSGALDISVSTWPNKSESIPQWLDGADKLALNLVIEENMMRECLMDVAIKAIGVYANCPEMAGLEKWIDQLQSIADEIITQTEDEFTVRKIETQLAAALFDVAQIYRFVGKSQMEIQYARKAIDYYERNTIDSDDVENLYRLANLYYQIGMLEASGQASRPPVPKSKTTHIRAAGWFAKAIRLFQQIESSLDVYEQPVLGEMYVSIGATYWAVDQREYALQITEYGVEMLLDAVDNKLYAEKDLARPYQNLSTMYEAMGRSEEAENYYILSRQAAQNITGGTGSTRK